MVLADLRYYVAIWRVGNEPVETGWRYMGTVWRLDDPIYFDRYTWAA
jgi:hypothetical protein